MIYKFNEIGTVSKYVNDDLVGSALLHDASYLAWIADGNTPEPYVAPVPTPLDQIAAIEAANPITHRNLRDLSMTVAQIAAAVTGTDPMVNPAVQQIALLQTAIDALREQARAQGLIA